MKKLIAFACALYAAVSAVAGPGAKEIVADGFATWEGIDDKNYIAGRRLTPSDLRHRTVFVLHLDAKALHAQFLATGSFIGGALGYPAAHAVQWDTLETFPRDYVALAVIHGECDVAKYREALKFPKGQDVEQADSSAMQAWGAATFAAIYGERAKLTGASDPKSYPTAQIVLPGATDVAWTGKFPAKDKKTLDAVKAELKKGKAAGSGWRPLYGVAEVQYWKAAEKLIRDGRPGYGVKAAVLLQKGVKDKNPDKAKEAQIMYDALMQFRDDLALRISREFSAAPARAFADMQVLLTAFPVDKKLLKDVDMKLKANKSASSLGKMYMDYIKWSQPDFTFKTASEAKKAKQEIAKWRKTLDLLSNDDKNQAIQGEAALLLSLVDALADTLDTKVPQK